MKELWAGFEASPTAPLPHLKNSSRQNKWLIQSSGASVYPLIDFSGNFVLF